MPVAIIPLFAEKPSHPFVPLGRRSASAHSEGQGRRPAGASREPFAAASTLAGWRQSGGGSAVVAAILLLLAPGAALAHNVTAERVAASHPYVGHVVDAAQRFRIPEAWLWAVMRVESNGNSRAVSTAGAMGLMQIMPTSWAGLRARYRLGSDPFDVRDNIMAGAAYLREMFDRYGNATAMLAAYNAGPGRYHEHLSRGRPLPAETRAYLAKLASITGSSDTTQLAAAPAPDSLAWRHAALFAARSGPASAMPAEVANDAGAVPPGRPPAGLTEVATVAATSPSTGLFVPLSGRSPP